MKEMGKGQNVKNHFVESLKKNIESLKVDWLIRTSKVFFLIDQNVKNQNVKKNIESLICLIFKFYYLWRKYLWRFGVNLKS
jgi:hypothetical protein